MGFPCSSQSPTGKPIVLTAANTREKVYLNIDNVTCNKKLDVESLLNLVDNIIYAAIPEEPRKQQGNITPELPHSFKSPLCSLKKISHELMACKAPGEGIEIEKTAREIINLGSISSYLPDEKLALIVAALSLEFWEFWCLRGMEFSDHERSFKSTAILKRVPLASTDSTERVISELKHLIRIILQVTRCICELEKLRSQCTISSDTIASKLSENVQSTIWAVVACATQISILKFEYMGEPLDLSQFTKILNPILEELRKQKGVYQQQRETEVSSKLDRLCAGGTGVHSKLVKIIGGMRLESPNKVVEILKLMIYGETEAHPLYIKDSPEGQSMDILERKKVLLLISSADISEHDIDMLREIYDKLHEKSNTYNIVWIPIEEHWTPERLNVFVEKRDQMPWHVVQFVSPIAGIQFIKEEWKFNGQPMVVLMNSKGKVENHNAIHAIRLWGMQAFPFTEEEEKKKMKTIQNWLSLVTKNNIDDPDKDTPLDDCIKKDNYIFFYGGTDHKWIQKFKTKVTGIKCTTENSISLLQLEKDGLYIDEEKLEIKVEDFWTRIESFYSVEMNNGGSEHKTREALQKLRSYKTESRWAILTEGSRVIAAENGTKISKALKKLSPEDGRELKIKFEECYEVVIKKFGHSSRIDTLKYCSACERQTEALICYKCIHRKDRVRVNANHYDGLS